MITSRRRRTPSAAMGALADVKRVGDYRSELWQTADALRSSMDAAEYKHVVLGLIFLKYISDAFQEAYAKDEAGDYADGPGFCKSATLEETRRHGHVLTSSRYVGAEPQPEDDEPFHEKMTRLAALWREQQAEVARLDGAIEVNLKNLGFGAGR